MSDSPLIGLRGTGRLRDAVEAELRGRLDLVDPAAAEPTAPPTAVLVIADRPLQRADVRPAEAAVPVLPLSVEFGQIVLGPLSRPGTAGCWTCADLRRRRNHPERAAMIDANMTDLAARVPALLSTFAIDTVATLAAAEIESLRDGATLRTEAAFLRVSLTDLGIQVHRFLADPLCPDCGDRPDDSAEAATIALRPRVKPRPGAFRIRSVTGEEGALLRTFVDEEAGLVAAVQTGDEGGLPVATAPLTMRGSTATEAGWGRSESYRASVVTAVLEAVERWGGLQAGGRRTVVRAAFDEVRDVAVDPRALGLYAPGRYAAVGFPFTPFRTDLELRWVWAHSFARGEAVLVPEAYAYYGAHVLEPDEPRLAYEISNGCALGGCLEEAILYGLLEVAERDAFLMAWYARRPLARIDLDTAVDPGIRLLAAHLEESTRRTITVFDTTVEQGIPSVWAIAVDRAGGPDRATALCAGGAHVDPERAVVNALRELGPILASVDRSYQQNRERVAAMIDDSDLVRSMGDHSLLYADRDAFPRLEFLFASRESRSLVDMAERSIPVSDDLGRDVEHAIGRYLADGLDVLVVDQTTAEHRAADLACVKVIVPGTLPMTFGHSMRRVDGLPRLFTVPSQLGDPAPPATTDDLNPHPHPFP